MLPLGQLSAPNEIYEKNLDKVKEIRILKV